MENKEKEIVNQDTKELITRYLENFDSKDEFNRLLNILVTTKDEEFINLLKQSDLKEFGILKLMGIITKYETENLNDIQLLRLIELLRRVVLIRINDFMNAIKLGKHEEYLSKLSKHDKLTLISFINNIKELFDELDEHTKNTLEQYREKAIQLIFAAIVKESVEEKKEYIQDKQKSL